MRNATPAWADDALDLAPDAGSGHREDATAQTPNGCERSFTDERHTPVLCDAQGDTSTIG